jgi:hypothetical protein
MSPTQPVPFWLLAGLLATAGIIVMARGWFPALLALLAQYALLGAFLGEGLLLPPFAAAKVMAGAAACAILVPSLGLPGGRGGQSAPHQGRLAWGLLELVLLGLGLLVAGLGAHALAQRILFPGASQDVAFLVYWLIAAGILTAFSTGEPRRAGAGLLTALSGLDVAYIVLAEGEGIPVLALLGLLTILVALASASLASAGRGAWREVPD